MLTDKEQEEIRRKLLGLEEEPPADGWKKIAAEINPTPPSRPRWWLWLAALLLLLTGAGTYVLLTNKPAAQLVQQEQHTTIVEQTATATDASTATIANNTPAEESAATVTPGTTPTNSTGGENAERLVNKPTTPVQTAAPDQPANTPEPTKPGVKPIAAKAPVLLATAPETKPRTITTPREQETIETEKPLGAEANNTAAANTNTAHTAAFLKMRETQLGDSALSAPERVPFILSHDPTIVKQPATNRDTLEEKQRKEWFVSLAFAPRYSFKAVTPATSDDIYITNLRTNNKLDPERMGYEFGLNVGQQLKKQLYLEAGLSLMQLREDVTYNFTNGKVDTLLQVRQSDGSFKATPVYVTDERQLKSSFMYGGARLGVTYFFWEQARQRFNLTMAGGMNLLVKGRTQTYSNGQLKETIHFPSEDNLLEQANYNLMIGAGYNTTLQGKYELMLMPNLNYFLGSTYNKREPFGIKPYSLGLSIQLRRRFY